MLEEEEDKLNSYKLPIISLLLILLLSFFVLYTPMPVLKSDETKFSELRAASYIKEISKEPHSYYDQEALKRVREYIEDTLVEYVGAQNVTNYFYTKEDVIE